MLVFKLLLKKTGKMSGTWGATFTPSERSRGELFSILQENLIFLNRVFVAILFKINNLIEIFVIHSKF